MANIKQKRKLLSLVDLRKYGTANLNDTDCNVCVGVGIWEGFLAVGRCCSLICGAEKGVGSPTIGLSTQTLRSSFSFSAVRQCWTLSPLALHSQPLKLLGYLQACNHTNKTRMRRSFLCYPCMHRKLSRLLTEPAHTDSSPLTGCWTKFMTLNTYKRHTGPLAFSYGLGLTI